jgi:hypothetical protein
MHNMQGMLCVKITTFYYSSQPHTQRSTGFETLSIKVSDPPKMLGQQIAGGLSRSSPDNCPPFVEDNV